MSNTRLTIFDIAKIAGVSRSTVSRALNNDSGISDETKEKILNVIKEMNYLMREQDEADEERFRKLDAAIRGNLKKKEPKKRWGRNKKERA